MNTLVYKIISSPKFWGWDNSVKYCHPYWFDNIRPEDTKFMDSIIAIELVDISIAINNIYQCNEELQTFINANYWDDMPYDYKWKQKQKYHISNVSKRVYKHTSNNPILIDDDGYWFHVRKMQNGKIWIPIVLTHDKSYDEIRDIVLRFAYHNNYIYDYNQYSKVTKYDIVATRNKNRIDQRSKSLSD